MIILKFEEIVPYLIKRKVKTPSDILVELRDVRLPPSHTWMRDNSYYLDRDECLLDKEDKDEIIKGVEEHYARQEKIYDRRQQKQKLMRERRKEDKIRTVERYSVG